MSKRNGTESGVPPLCRGCGREREPRQYLCIVCWYTLPNSTRALLRLKDAHASVRLRDLYDGIYRGVPLDAIQVSIGPARS